MTRLLIQTKSKNEEICSKVVFRKNIFSQGTGLMFHRKIKDEAHIFVMQREKIIPLTNWFVFFPIDVVYLDRNKKIVEIKKDFRPFTYYNPKHDSMYVIELPEKTIEEKGLKVGDKLEF